MTIEFNIAIERERSTSQTTGDAEQAYGIRHICWTDRLLCRVCNLTTGESSCGLSPSAAMAGDEDAR